MTSPSAISYSSPVNFLVPQTPPSGLDPLVDATFRQVYTGLQQIILALTSNCGIGSRSPSDQALLSGSPQTILRSNLGRIYLEAVENILEGAAITLTTSAGLLVAANANSTDATKPCDGFCDVSGGIALGAVGEFILGSGLINIGGLTMGTRYWLSSTNGVIQAGPDTTPGHIEQYIGIALSDTQILVNPTFWLQH